MTTPSRAVARFFHALILLCLGLSLALPGAQAAEHKKAGRKKPAATVSARHAAVKTQRKQAASAKTASASTRDAKTKARAKTRTAHTSAHRAKTGKRARVAVAPPPSLGQQEGLREAGDPLALKSSVALVIDQDTKEVLLRKNDQAVLPIASLTKLMTGLLISEAKLPMDEAITITQDDVDTEKGSRSRLVVGATLTRGEMLHLALMSSENRAAHALGRTAPGGLAEFVARMNAKARQLGMSDTHYVEPTGLSSLNQSSAHDLATLVGVASHDPLLRELTTSPSYEVAVGHRTLQFNNTNRLVKNPAWDIGLQKTGYINEAGRCLVMQAQVAGRKLIMVFLDSEGKYSRLGDAERVRSWVEKKRLPANGLAWRAGGDGFKG
jgi:D-alanyl-D-alanine endopeptidase (penicillin-binding protein 7)